MNIYTFASYSECVEAIRTFEIESQSRFCVCKATKGFGSHDIKTAKQAIFEDKASTTIGFQTFNGVPFAVLGQKRLDCQFGKDRKFKVKSDRRIQKGSTRVRALSTKKLGCPAKTIIRELVRFPSYRVESNPPRAIKKQINDEILRQIRNGDAFDWQPQYVLCLPSPENHIGHPLNQCGAPELVDYRISAKIKELTHAGVKTVPEMKVHLDQYVCEISDVLPNPENKRFYPTNKIIGNHMYTAHGGRRTSKDPQSVQKKKKTTSTRKTARKFYVCLHCEAAAKVHVSEKFHMISHIYTHHASLDQTPFYCTLCLFRCKTRATLEKHIMGHGSELQQLGRNNLLGRNPNPKLVKEGVDYRLANDTDMRSQVNVSGVTSGNKQVTIKITPQRLMELLNGGSPGKAVLPTEEAEYDCGSDEDTGIEIADYDNVCSFDKLFAVSEQQMQPTSHPATTVISGGLDHTPTRLDVSAAPVRLTARASTVTTAARPLFTATTVGTQKATAAFQSSPSITYKSSQLLESACSIKSFSPSSIGQAQEANQHQTNPDIAGLLTTLTNTMANGFKRMAEALESNADAMNRMESAFRRNEDQLCKIEQSILSMSTEKARSEDGNNQKRPQKT